jgi:subtilisin
LQDQLGNSVQVIKDGIIQLPEMKEAFSPAGKPGGGGGGGGNSQVIPWGINAVNAPPAWATTRGENCYVCIIDSGINRTHPDLAPNIRMGENYINGGSWEDKNGHGTHVAGTIAALDNSIGVVGVAPNAQLLVAQAFGANGTAEFSDTADAALGCMYMRNQLDPLHQKGLVINMSFGSYDISGTSESLLRPVLQTAYNEGAILVAAAGNTSGYAVQTPAKWDEVLAVTAMTEDQQLASFSSIARNDATIPHMYIAPGVGVNSTWKAGSYKLLDGTSMAAPHVSGIAALMLSANSAGIIATDIGLDPRHQGLGLPDAYLTVLNQAVLSLASSTAVPEPATFLLVSIGLVPLVVRRGR